MTCVIAWQYGIVTVLLHYRTFMVMVDIDNCAIVDYCTRKQNNNNQ